MSKVIETCPSCGSPMVITRLSCTHCDTEVTGSFESNIFSQLAPDDLQFVELFLACRGNVKEMERESGLSYWTIRGRLNDILAVLGLDQRPIPDQGEKRRDILAALQRGEITVGEAEEKLKALKGSREEG